MFNQLVSSSRQLVALLMVLSVTAVFAQENKALYEDLKSQDDATVINALEKLGEEKDEEAVEKIANLLKLDKSYNVHAQAIMALGKIQKQDPTTKKLRDFLKTTNDANLAYLAVAAMVNVVKENDQAAKDALNTAEQRFPDDKYIQDAVKKIKAKINSL